MSAISAIYVRLPNWIGDVCMCLPCLDALLDTGVPVVVCARAWARDLLQGYPMADFIVMEKSWNKNRLAIDAHRKATQQRHAVGLLLPDSLSSALSFRLAGLHSAGYRDDGRSLLLRWALTKPEQTLHAVESWYLLTRNTLALWQLPVPSERPPANLGLRLTSTHQQAAHKALERAGIKAQRFVLIAPTATGLHQGRVKVWPGFEDLAKRLIAAGHTVVMCPPANEVDAARANAPSARLLAPLGLGAFATLTQLASLVICNDSGVSHLAAAAHARQLTLFGVTDPRHTGPWSFNARCLGNDHRWPTTDEVYEVAIDLLSTTSINLEPQA